MKLKQVLTLLAPHTHNLLPLSLFPSFKIEELHVFEIIDLNIVY